MTTESYRGYTSDLTVKIISPGLSPVHLQYPFTEQRECMLIVTPGFQCMSCWLLFLEKSGTRDFFSPGSFSQPSSAARTKSLATKSTCAHRRDLNNLFSCQKHNSDLEGGLYDFPRCSFVFSQCM